MPAPAYYRKQADVCLRLASLSESPEIMTRLLAMAETYVQRCTMDGQSRHEAPLEGAIGAMPCESDPH